MLAASAYRYTGCSHLQAAHDTPANMTERLLNMMISGSLPAGGSTGFKACSFML